jgi:hypothetical protein
MFSIDADLDKFNVDKLMIAQLINKNAKKLA